MRRTRRAARSCRFLGSDQRLAESLASQAAIALTNRMLINQLEELFESFINLINIGDRRKVALHRRALPARAGADHDARRGGQRHAARARWRAFTMTDKDRYELKIAGLLHDCGKVTTPVHVVDKATKLQTIFDRIHLIDTRFEVLKRDAEIELLQGQRCAAREKRMTRPPRLDAAHLQPSCGSWTTTATFLRRRNIGGERMRAKPTSSACGDIGTRYTLAQRRSAHEADFLTADEIDEPDHPRRHADRGGARDHQPPHRRDDQDARGAALAAAPDERAGIRRRPPRAHGRQGLPEGADARADVGAGAHAWASPTSSRR